MWAKWAATAVLCFFIGARLAAGEATGDEAPTGTELPSEGEVARALAAVAEAVEGLTPAAPPAVIHAATPAAAAAEDAELLAGYRHLWTVAACYGLRERTGSICCRVHRFASEIDAFGPFSRLKGPSAQDAVAIPTMAYWVGEQLHVWRGEYYVRISPVPPDTPEPQAPDALPAVAVADARATVGLIAEAFLGTIPVPSRLPTLLSIVPLPGRFLGPVSFDRVSVDGVAQSVERVSVRLVETHASECVLSIYRTVDTADARAIYAGWLGGRGGATHLPLLADDAAVATGPDASVDACMRQDNYVACIRGGTSRRFAEAVLMIVASHVRIVLVTGDLSDPL